MQHHIEPFLMKLEGLANTAGEVSAGIFHACRKANCAEQAQPRRSQKRKSAMMEALIFFFHRICDLSPPYLPAHSCLPPGMCRGP